MSDETTTTATEATTDTTRPAGPVTRPNRILTNTTDHAARPGFRSAANTKSKIQKAGKKK
jgi:hypothetical protein